MTFRERCIPVRKPLPSIKALLDMKAGRLATETFGKTTDPVFTVVRVPWRDDYDEPIQESQP